MKKILCFIDSLGAGGAQRQIVGLARELRHKGYDVVLGVYTDIPFYLPEVERYKIKCENVTFGHSKILRVFYIYKYVIRLKPECVISYLATPSLIMALIKFINKRFKLIVSERNTTQILKFKDKLRFYLFRNADYIVSNSYSQTNFIENHYPLLKDKCSTIVNFVDTNRFVKILHKTNDFKTFVVAASITKSKNTLNFIKSIQAVLNIGYKNFVVKWFGIVDRNNTYYLTCREYIELNNLSAVVKLLPKTSRIEDEYANADFFCLPSLYEGTPNALCEALSCGIPSICSAVSDNANYVKDSYNGFLFNPSSIEEMSSAVIKCLTMPAEVYITYSDRSRKIAEEQLCIEKFVDSYVNLIEG